MLSMAITAGVAPLLFLQIIYKKEFYTANLLLFHRWMAILPVLIIGFYLSYLSKAKLVHSWPFAARAAVGFGMFACFGFIGWSWVENHLLSVSSNVWAEQYASGAIIFRSPELLPRLTLWFVAAFPTMALLVGWQLWYKRENDEALPGSRRASSIALAGAMLSVVAAAVYFATLPQTARETVTGPVAKPYFFFIVAGGATEIAAWVVQFRQSRLTRKWLTVATVGLVLHFVGMAVVNEATRLAVIDIRSLYDEHLEAWSVNGRVCFLFFLILNSAVIAYCVRLVTRSANT